METSPQNVAALCSRFRERSQRFFAARLKEFGLDDLAPSHGDVLVALLRGGPMTAGELASAVDRDKSTLSGIISSLERAGYLERKPSPTDGRAVLVAATHKAAERAQSFKEIGRLFMERAYAGFSPAERLMLVELLDRLNQNMD